MRNSFRILLLALFAAVVNPASSEQPATGSETGCEAIEQQIHSLVNRQRQSQKRLPLSIKGAITAQCRLHSRNMALGLVPAGHQGVAERAGSLQPAITVRTYSENVAVSRGYKNPARDAVDGWMKNPEHRKAILGDYDLTGVGVAMTADSTFYFTQMFVKSR